MESLIFNGIGTLGVALILGTYFALQTHRIEASELRYSLLNFFGSAFIVISLLYDFNLPSFIVEVSWVGISTIGIWRWWQERRKLQAA